MTLFATELATPSVTDVRYVRYVHVRTDTLPRLIYKDFCHEVGNYEMFGACPSNFLFCLSVCRISQKACKWIFKKFVNEGNRALLNVRTTSSFPVPMDTVHRHICAWSCGRVSRVGLVGSVAYPTH